MTSTLLSPHVISKSSHVSRLHVRRQGIVFYNSAPGRVRIEVEVTNLGKERSRPSPMVLESAAFGAFLPWQPLETLTVPPIGPKGTVRVVTEVDQKRLPSLEDFADVPPRRLPAVGLDMGDREPERSWQERLSPVSPPPETKVVIPSKLGSHWAGNISVFVGQVAVERHHASALRIYPGCANCANFAVGFRQDAYSFHLEGDGALWDAMLVGNGDTHVKVIEPGTWVEAVGRFAVTLQIRPPESCTRGAVEVHVRQRSSGRTAVVEFDLDASAAEPGCYTV